ncbi:MAG TPA: lysoplasmalogenase [Myxococcota bacterium]|nr:lysoplasmalogenase [Myxococcota bacterium]
MTGGALAALAALGCGLAVVGLLAAERAGSRAGVWVAKPLASAGFVLVALARGATGTTYGRWVLAALVLGWLGDVLLIPKGARRAFAAGLGSFLLGHVAFAAGFVSRGQSFLWLGVGLALVLAAAVPLLRWLMPHVGKSLGLPVRAYFAVISAMVATAAGATGATGDLRLVFGALGFAVSDVTVARERFVTHSPWNGGLGLPLYYASQLLLAATAG